VVELRNYSLDFAEKFAEYRNNETVLNNGYDKIPRPFTLKDAVELINLQLENKKPNRFFIFCDGEFAGEIGATVKEDVFRLNAEIGYFVAEPFWGKGIATEAIKLITDYIFANFDTVRVVAGVFDFNKASMKALEKNGYYLESIRKNAVIKNGQIMDDCIWVKLKSD